jgi:hypothetical protein
MAESEETITGIAMAGGPAMADGVAVPAARQPAEALDSHIESVQPDDTKPAFVRESGGGLRGGPPHRAADPNADPAASVQRRDAAGFGEDA